jgi:uncharacterized protein
MVWRFRRFQTSPLDYSARALGVGCHELEVQMSARNKEIIKKVNDAFARNDVEGFLIHCHDDFQMTMVGDKPVKGKDAIRKSMASAPSEAPKFTVDTVVSDGDIVTCIGDMTMNEKGADVPYSYCDVWRFKGDKLAELRAFVIKTERVGTPTTA